MKRFMPVKAQILYPEDSKRLSWEWLVWDWKHQKCVGEPGQPAKWFNGRTEARKFARQLNRHEWTMP